MSKVVGDAEHCHGPLRQSSGVTAPLGFVILRSGLKANPGTSGSGHGFEQY
jgi:hypothetical protein